MTSSALIDQINFKYIFFRGRRYNPILFNQAVDEIVKHLRTNIRSTSPFILLTAYNHIKTIIAYHAILRMGKIVAILDPGWKSMEASEIIEDLDPAAIIFINTGTCEFKFDEEVVFRKTNKSFIISTDIADVCTIVYTNAEDGYSKGAMLTKKNILTEVHAIIKANRLNEKSVIYSLLPFSHLYGLILGVLISTLSGTTAVITELNLLKIQEILNEIKKFKVSHIYSVPSVYYIMSKFEGIEHFIKNIKMCISGGNKLSYFIYDNFFKRTNLKIFEGYGLTETSPACTFNFPEDEPNVLSVGKPLAGSDIRIFDENDNECESGKTGEICVKGDLVFKGYFNKNDNTDMVMKNSWLHTGDYGKVDNNGYIYFCGIKKNMINVAGNKIYPKKLERMMKVNKNVLEVNIFSEDSLLQGQVVSTRIKLKDNSLKAQNEFKNWCFKNINNLMLPKYWEFE